MEDRHIKEEFASSCLSIVLIPYLRHADVLLIKRTEYPTVLYCVAAVNVTAALRSFTSGTHFTLFWDEGGRIR